MEGEPAHATTNSAHDVTDIRRLTGVLETVQRIGMSLLIHSEVTDRHVDIFDREAVFIETILAPLVRDYPALKIVLAHITTEEAAATITPQHLIVNRNAIFDVGIRPMPIACRSRSASGIGSPCGARPCRARPNSSSAPTARCTKLTCGCADIFNAPFAPESYAQVLEEDDALDHFEGFAPEHGARRYPRA